MKGSFSLPAEQCPEGMPHCVSQPRPILDVGDTQSQEPFDGHAMVNRDDLGKGQVPSSLYGDCPEATRERLGADPFAQQQQRTGRGLDETLPPRTADGEPRPPPLEEESRILIWLWDTIG